jgi:hypothetical protein
MKKLLSLTAGILAGALAPSAQAAIVMGTVTGGTIFTANPAGQFVELNPRSGPFTVGQDNFNTNNVYGFDEKQGFTLTAALAADLGVRTVPIGTRVNSHFLFFDPLRRQTAQATILFDTPVLAAITLRPQLIASNFLGAANVTYLTPASFGLEPGTDFLGLGAPTANALRIQFLSTDSPGDHFRVLTLAQTLAVPEPLTWLQMLAGFCFLGLQLRRRAKGFRRNVTA